MDIRVGEDWIIVPAANKDPRRRAKSIGPMTSQPAASPISRKLMNASAATPPRADPAAARRRDAHTFERLIEPHRAG